MLSESKAENLQNGNVHFAQILDFEMGYLKNKKKSAFLRKTSGDFVCLLAS